MYREVILDHYKSPRGHGLIEDADAQAEGENPLCGDEVTISVKFADDGETIAAIGFEGRGCAISQAATSMLTELVQGRTAAESPPCPKEELLDGDRHPADADPSQVRDPRPRRAQGRAEQGEGHAAAGGVAGARRRPAVRLVARCRRSTSRRSPSSGRARSRSSRSAGRRSASTTATASCYALEDRCSHDDGPLCEGEWDEDTCRVICPRHGSAFDLAHGPPALPARVRAGRDLPGDRRGRHRQGRGRRDIDYRCWETTDPLYLAYHDEEWGRPVATERGLYERLCLEGFQSGLSWLTILRKREGFRAAFAGFDPDARRRDSASGTSSGCSRTPRSSGTAARSRRRSRTRARRWRCARPARRCSELFWVAPAGATAPRSPADWLATTPESAALSKALRSAGFRFVGPTTAYAAMQACGVVNDHLARCCVRAAVEAERRPSTDPLMFSVNRGKEVVRRWRFPVRAVEVPARRGVSPGPDGNRLASVGDSR